MGEILNGIDRQRIDDLLRRGTFFWVDLQLGSVTADELGTALDIPDGTVPWAYVGEGTGVVDVAVSTGSAGCAAAPNVALTATTRIGPGW